MCAIQYQSWNEVKHLLPENSELRVALERLVASQKTGNQKTQFVKLSYPYGSLLMDQGKFCLPPGTSKSDFDSLTKRLGLSPNGQNKYTAFPVGFVAKNTLEVGVRIPTDTAKPHEINSYTCAKSSVCYDDHLYWVAPQALLRQGDLFGLFEFLDARLGLGTLPPYDVSAGSRAAFITGKISTEEIWRKLESAFSPKEEEESLKTSGSSTTAKPKDTASTPLTFAVN